MTSNRLTVGGRLRRTPGPGLWARPPALALLTLALVGLGQGGCAYDGCSNCGLSGLGSRITNGVQTLGTRVADGTSRLFHHKGNGGCSTCGDGGYVEGGTVIDSGIPTAPGEIIMQGSGPTTIVPPPVLDSTPSQLAPIDDAGSAAKPTNATGGSAAPKNASGNNQSAYEASIPRNKLSRGRTIDVARAYHSTPEPARPMLSTPNQTDANDLFGNIPPVDVPAEVTRKASSLPPTVTTPTPVAPTPVTDASKLASPPPAETDSAVEGPSATLAGRLTPGIRRSASVAPSVGGGSVPSMDGLDWLKEKGYRTFLDLRSMSEVDPNFVESVNDRGMFYLSLPIMAERLDANRLARFDELIAQVNNRPLYFCDTDGTRAGLMWYIHLRATEGIDAQSAFQRAEEIGLTETQARLGETYLASHKSKLRAPIGAQAPSPVTPVAIASPSKPSEEKPVTAPAPALPSAAPGLATIPAPVAAPTPAVAPVPAMLPGENRPQASSSPDRDRYRDPIAWRPVAALVLAGIGVPLAYWSKSAIIGVRSSRKLASLPGSAPRSLGAPDGSDA